MKKTALLFFGLLLSWASAHAQQLQKSHLVKSVSESETAPSSTVYNKMSATQAVVWSDNFSNAAAWKASRETGTTGDWVVGAKPPAGTYKLNVINSTSKGSFALFDSDLICSKNQVAYLTNVTPIDLSTHPFVRLSFEQHYKRWYDSTFVLVSSDNAKWDWYEVNENVETGDPASANPEKISLDISPSAGGKQTVYIRFCFYSPSTLDPDAGCGYSWQIDDVAISDLQRNDIGLNSSYMDIAGSGYYTQIPKSQVDSVRFFGIAANKGSQTQKNVQLNVDVTDGGTSVYSQKSDTISLPYRKGSILSIDKNMFAVPAIGGKNYEVSFRVTQTETDSFPSDNLYTKSFSVSESVYARDNGDLIKAGTTSPGFYINGDVDESSIGNLYSIQKTERLGSVSVYIHKTSTKEIKPKIRALIYLANPDPAGGTLPLFDLTYASDYVTIDSTKFNSWITLPLKGTPIFTEGMSYLVSIEQYGITPGTATKLGKFIVFPSDNNIQDQLYVVSYVFLAGTSKWIAVPDIPFIRLNTLSFSSVAESETDLFRVSNWPNPFHKTTSISYELDRASQVSLDVYDMTGRQVMSVNDGFKNPGKNSLLLNTSLPQGLYFYTLRANNRSVTKKMIVID